MSFVTEDVAAAVEQPGSFKAAEAWLASAAQAITIANACTESNQPVVITEVHIAEAEESSSKVDTSATLEEHTKVAVVERSKPATEASDIVKEPSFEVVVGIGTGLKPSNLHLHDYLLLCLSHQSSFKEEVAADT